jgi:hypothetical protein
MRKYFANPYQPDIYIEADGMQDDQIIEIDHKFYKESQQMIIERFAQHGINVYIDDGWPDGPVNGGGELVSHYGATHSAFKTNYFYLHNFADERKGIFRYLLVNDETGGHIFSLSYNRFDSLVVGNNLKGCIFPKMTFTPRVIRIMLAKSVLHELGHSLGLMPWTFKGNDIAQRSYGDRYPSMSDEDYEGYLNEYYSIMNYNYIYNKPFLFNDGSRTYLFDYSDGSNGPPYDQDDWIHIYLPSFYLDQVAYEEPDDLDIEKDFNFEEFEEVYKYPGVTAVGWEYDKQLTNELSSQFLSKTIVKNIDHDIQIFVKTDKENEEDYNIRVYARPNVDPVFAIWSLYAEGHLDSNGEIQLYTQQTNINEVKELME